MHRKGTTKLNALRDIEVAQQSEWEKCKIFEAKPFDPQRKEKHFVTFPYPYMNGVLHLGHAFSLSKCEFSMGFEKLQGKNTMWGFGLHCTGMPIKSSSDKLCREIAEFGYPPVFPDPSNEPALEVTKKEVGADKSKGKKTKAVAKSGGLKYQWQIMRSNGMSDIEIKKFTDPMYWLEYFPPMTIEHMRLLGIKVDWRRSFVTTDANPFYDSFVRWQFNRLKQSNKIQFGKRETIFSPRDKQPCMDHDRSSGEGVGPQEYTLMKLKLSKPYPSVLDDLGNNISLVAATLRPETIYGLTNCWIHPDLTYVAVKSSKHGVLICVERSAKNMAYQEILSEDVKDQGVIEILSKFKGVNVIGCAVTAPLSSQKEVYILPMLTIKESKGTGIVMSVPSDSPDDFAALRDLKKKTALREKYNISENIVMSIEPIQIIETEKYGKMCAPVCVEELKIQSQNDTDKLEVAKENCYKYGFYHGKLLIGKYAGQSVQTVKDKIQTDLVLNNDAIKYFEPEKLVMSRSGDECVVAKCDQWYLRYDDEEWKTLTRNCLAQVETFSKDVKNCFEATIERLHEYACSRSYGLGSKIPWDEQYLVESLSDSTIYMAYYTVAHYLQGDQLNGRSGKNMSGITPEEMNNDAWEYVLGDSSSVTNISDSTKSKLETLKAEFLYWYPVDLRVSGKDLVPNHLTFYLYNHCAIWPENSKQYWPKKIRANGHLLLNNDKMSKSTGNYLTVVDAVEKYSADGMRLALADSGDTVEDANFVEDMADAGVLRLYSFLEWVKEMVNNKDQMRRGKLSLHCDLVFKNDINRTIMETERHYKDMMYRRVVQVAFHEFQSTRDRYREFSMNDCHHDLIMRFIEVQCLLLSPICPHICDHIWKYVLNKPQSILEELWPVVDSLDDKIVTEGAFIDRILNEFRKQALQKPRIKTEIHNSAVIWVAKSYPKWQKMVLDTMVQMAQDGKLPDNRELNATLSKKEGMSKKMKKVMDLIQVVREKTNNEVILVDQLMKPEINERHVIEVNMSYVEKTLGLKVGRIEVRYSEECNDEKLFDSCCPMNPKIVYFNVPEDCESSSIEIVNPQLYLGYFSVNVLVNNNDSVYAIIRKIADKSMIIDYSRIKLYRITNKNPEMIPNHVKIYENLEILPLSARFTFNDSNLVLSFNSELINVGNKLKYFYE